MRPTHVGLVVREPAPLNGCLSELNSVTFSAPLKDLAGEAAGRGCQETAERVRLKGAGELLTKYAHAMDSVFACYRGRRTRDGGLRIAAEGSGDRAHH